jgi:hypothetical protein
MQANLFSIGDRTYLNNAVVIADSLQTIGRIFGNVMDYKIKFRKPFLSQANFVISTEKLDGHIVGDFVAAGTQFHFAYVPVEAVLETKELTDEVTPFSICYKVTDAARGVIEEGHLAHIGKMDKDEKVIFVIFEVPNTAVFNDAVKSGKLPKIKITEADHLGGKRFRLSVSLDGRLFGYRYSTVGKFAA